MAEALLEEKLHKTYTQYSHFEKWKKNSFILNPYQRVRVHLTNKGYEDIEVGFNLNENKIPLDVELKVPPLRIDTEFTDVQASTITTEDA